MFYSKEKKLCLWLFIIYAYTHVCVFELKIIDDMYYIYIYIYVCMNKIYGYMCACK